MIFTCTTEELKQGLIALKPIMQLTKRFLEFLLRVEDGEVQLCFHDGFHTFIYKIPATTEGTGEYMVDYAKFVNLVNCCSAAIGLEVKPIKCEIDDRNTLKLTVTKYLINKETNEEKNVSHMVYTLQTLNPQAYPKFQLFLQPQYATLFQYDSYDTWDMEHLYQIIKTLKGEDKNALLYFDATEHKVKARQLNTAIIMDTPYIDTHNFVIYSSEAQALTDCCSKLSNEIYIHNEANQYLLITSEAKNFALSFKMPEGQITDKKAFELFELIQVKDIHFKIHKATFTNVLRALRNTSSLDKYRLKIKQSSDKYILNVLTTQSNGTILSDMNVLIEDILCAEDIDVLNYTALFNLETFLTILSRCKSTWVEFNANTKENRMYQIKDVDIETTDKLTTYYYGVLEKD